MVSSPSRGVTFCRFGYDETLTLDRVVQLIEQKDLWAGELLQIDGAKEWIAARDVPQLRPYFGDASARPVDRRERRPYERGERPPFRAAFNEDNGTDWEGAERAYLRFFGAIVILFALFWLVPALLTLSVEFQSARWPKTTGVALRASPNDSGSMDVTYEYVLAHAHYRAKDKLPDVHKGQEVAVRYSPQRPGTSTLADGIRGTTVSSVLIGVVLASIGVGLVIRPKEIAALLNRWS